MTRKPYIALLRGINVSGSNLIKMDALKKSMESLGFINVKSYIQSGNLLFNIENPAELKPAQMIRKMIHEDFGLQVPVLVKTFQEWEIAINENPFLPKHAQSIECLHLTFLESQPAKSLVNNILPLQNGPDQGILIQDRIYLHCPEGYGKAKFTNTFFENKLKVKATTRNWKTVLKLQEMSIKLQS
jgi:uncharacterized protein (DUF1697 family)